MLLVVRNNKRLNKDPVDNLIFVSRFGVLFLNADVYILERAESHVFQNGRLTTGG